MFKEAHSKNTNDYIQLGKEENGWGAAILSGSWIWHPKIFFLYVYESTPAKKGRDSCLYNRTQRTWISSELQRMILKIPTDLHIGLAKNTTNSE